MEIRVRKAKMKNQKRKKFSPQSLRISLFVFLYLFFLFLHNKNLVSRTRISFLFSFVSPVLSGQYDSSRVTGRRMACTCLDRNCVVSRCSMHANCTHVVLIVGAKHHRYIVLYIYTRIVKVGSTRRSRN